MSQTLKLSIKVTKQLEYQVRKNNQLKNNKLKNNKNKKNNNNNKNK